MFFDKTDTRAKMEKHEESDLVRWMREWKCIAECCNGNFGV